jgi:hypothetical protein
MKYPGWIIRTGKLFTISNTDTKVRVRARLLMIGRNRLKTINYDRAAICLALLLLNGYWSEKLGHRILFTAIHGVGFSRVSACDSSGPAHQMFLILVLERRI